MTVLIVGFSNAHHNVWLHRLGGVQPLWNWHGEVRHLHDPWLLWKQVLHGNRHQEIWRKSNSFSNGWQRWFHLLQITTIQNISKPFEEHVAVVAGVWGSAFSILFNRVLGIKDTAGGSTMEEELGTIIIIIIKIYKYICIEIRYFPTSRSLKSPFLTVYLYAPEQPFNPPSFDFKSLLSPNASTSWWASVLLTTALGLQAVTFCTFFYSQFCPSQQ